MPTELDGDDRAGVAPLNVSWKRVECNLWTKNELRQRFDQPVEICEASAAAGVGFPDAGRTGPRKSL